MRFEDPQGKGKNKGKDDTATNGFRWRFCGYPNWSNQKDLEFEGNWGTWRGMVMCPTGHYVFSFRARIEGIKMGGDGTAMNGL